MKPSLLVFFCLMFICCEKSENEYQRAPLCDIPPFSKRLKMMISKSTQPLKQDTTWYFYDALSRVDSIKSAGGARKILYDAQGRVESTLRYSYHPNGQLQGPFLSQYAYSDSSVTIKDMYSESTFVFHSNGSIKSSERLNSNDRTVYTVDPCGQVTTVEDIYHASQNVHFLYTIKYSDVFDPLYVIGMQHIDPGYQYNLYLKKTTEIVYWDCGDYISGPMDYTILHNSEYLPNEVLYPGSDLGILYIYE